MADIQLYTGEATGYSDEQIEALNKPLDRRLIKSRKGGNGKELEYIAGHTAIDQANRIFGYGNWAYKPVSCEQVILIDPLSGEAVGIEYKAMVELMVRGAIAPIVDIGSQPVATWNVEDQIMGRRINDAKWAKPPRDVDESPFTLLEKKNARAVIVEAHEQAKKGAVTDAMKRALRAYGNAFGNSLYGDGHVDVSVSEERTVESQRPPAPRQVAPRQLPPATSQAQPKVIVQAVPVSPTKTRLNAVYDAGKAKALWSSSEGMLNFVVALTGINVSKDTIYELPEELLAQFEKAVAEEPASKAS